MASALAACSPLKPTLSRASEHVSRAAHCLPHPTQEKHCVHSVLYISAAHTHWAQGPLLGEMVEGKDYRFDWFFKRCIKLKVEWELKISCRLHYRL